MIVYEVTNMPADQARWCGTIAEAKSAAGPRAFYLDREIRMFDLSTDKAGVVDVLNGARPVLCLRAWQPTKRGGWQEIDQDGNSIKERA